MLLHLIAAEINKASKFVFLLFFVTQRKGDVIGEVCPRTPALGLVFCFWWCFALSHSGFNRLQ